MPAVSVADGLHGSAGGSSHMPQSKGTARYVSSRVTVTLARCHAECGSPACEENRRAEGLAVNEGQDKGREREQPI